MPTPASDDMQHVERLVNTPVAQNEAPASNADQPIVAPGTNTALVLVEHKEDV
jgi:hypothetical protein